MKKKGKKSDKGTDNRGVVLLDDLEAKREITGGAARRLFGESQKEPVEANKGPLPQPAGKK